MPATGSTTARNPHLRTYAFLTFFLPFSDLSRGDPGYVSRMKQRPQEAIDAEIEALRARIRRLRLERKAAALFEAETKLLELAKQAEGRSVDYRKQPDGSSAE